MSAASSSNSSKPGITVCAIPGLTLVMRSRNPDFDPNEIFFVAQFPVNEGESESRDTPLQISFSREVDQQGRFFRVSVAAVPRPGSKHGSGAWLDVPPVVTQPAKSTARASQPTLDPQDITMAALEVDPYNHNPGADRSLLNSLSVAAPAPAPAPNQSTTAENTLSFDLAIAELLQNGAPGNSAMLPSYPSNMNMTSPHQLPMFNENDWLANVQLGTPPSTDMSLDANGAMNTTSALFSPPSTTGPSSERTSGSPASTTSESLQGFPCRHGSCGRTFSRQYNRDLHENSHVPKEPVTYACRALDCNATFRRQHDRMRHEVGQHQVEPDYSCEKCGKFYSTERRMHSHKCSSIAQQPVTLVHQA